MEGREARVSRGRCRTAASLNANNLAAERRETESQGCCSYEVIEPEFKLRIQPS